MRLQQLLESDRDPALEAKVASILEFDSPKNYACWEDAEESVLEELTDEEAEEYTSGGYSTVEEWFANNSDDQ